MFDRNRTDFSADTSKLAVAIRFQLLEPFAVRRNSVLLASMLMWAGSNVLAQDEPGKQVPPKSDSAKSQPNPSASGKRDHESSASKQSEVKSAGKKSDAKASTKDAEPKGSTKPAEPKLSPERKALLEEYRQKAEGVPADDLAGHLALAKWCSKNRLKKESNQHYEMVLKTNPDHEESRRALGYRKYNGEWKTTEQVMEEQGYVQHQGRWVLPQERDAELSTAAQKKNRQELYRQVRTLKGQYRSKNELKRQEAIAALKSIKDPGVVRPLMDNFGDKGEEEDRYFLVELLVGIDGNESTAGILTVAINDAIMRNRQAAITALKDRKSPQLLAELAKFLRDNNNDKVIRAADALAELGDSSMYGSLVEALVTTHTHVIEPSIMDVAQQASGSSVRQSVSPNGNVTRSGSQPNALSTGGMSVGNGPGPRAIRQIVNNQAVLDALVKLTGENFGFDKERWILWIQEKERKQPNP